MDNRNRVLEIFLFVLAIISVGSIGLFKIRVDYLSSIPLSAPTSSIVSKALYILPFILMIFNIGLLQLFKQKRVNNKIWSAIYFIMPLLVVGGLTVVHYNQLPYDFNYFYSHTGILPNVEIFIYIYLLALFVLGARINLHPAIHITNLSIGLLRQYFYRIPLLILLVWSSYSFVSISTIPSSIAHSSYPNNLTLDPRVEDVEKIASLTLNDAILVHPLRSGTYPFLGNQVMMRYFLAPRTLVTPEKFSKLLKDGNTNPIFIAIKNLESGYAWPIISFDDQTVFAVEGDLSSTCQYTDYEIVAISSYIDLISFSCKEIK